MDITIDNRELGDCLMRLEAKGRCIGRILPAAADALVSAVADIYEEEGPGWKDLAESTKRQRKGSSYKILQDDGIMAGSTSPGWGADWAEAFAGVPYAQFHSRGNANLPRRDPFDLPANPVVWSVVQLEIMDMVLAEVIL